MLYAQWYLNEQVCMSSSLLIFSIFIHSNGFFLVVCMRSMSHTLLKMFLLLISPEKVPRLLINNKVLISNVQVHFEVLV
jgi:hypothetical protein